MLDYQHKHTWLLIKLRTVAQTYNIPVCLLELMRFNTVFNNLWVISLSFSLCYFNHLVLICHGITLGGKAIKKARKKQVHIAHCASIETLDVSLCTGGWKVNPDIKGTTQQEKNCHSCHRIENIWYYKFCKHLSLSNWPNRSLSDKSTKLFKG